MNAFVLAGCLQFSLLLLYQNVLEVLNHAYNVRALRCAPPLKEIAFRLTLTGSFRLGARALGVESYFGEVWITIQLFFSHRAPSRTLQVFMAYLFIRWVSREYLLLCLFVILR